MAAILLQNEGTDLLSGFTDETKHIPHIASEFYRVCAGLHARRNRLPSGLGIFNLSKLKRLDVIIKV